MAPRTLPGFVIAAVLTGAPLPVGAQAPAPSRDSKKVQAEARLMIWGDGATAGRDRVDDVLVRRARLVVQGQPAGSFSFYIQVGQDNVGARLAERGSFAVKDAFIGYRAANALQVVIGQFKIPFLRANLESGFNQVLVDRGTLPTLRPAVEGTRDRGVMSWGNIGGLQYRFAVFARSRQPRVSTRVAYNWFANEPGLAYTGTYLGSKRVLQVAAQVDAQNSRVDSRDAAAFRTLSRDYRAYAVDGFYEQPLARSAMTLDGAWFGRRDTYDSIGMPARRQNGYYAQGALLLPGRLGPGRIQVAFRREHWTIERGAPPQRSGRTTGGLTYYLKNHNRKAVLDYTRKTEAPGTASAELRLSLAVVF